MASLSGKYTFFAYISASYMVNIYISEFHYILTRGFYVKSLLIDKNRQKCIFIGHKNANLLQNFPKLTHQKNKIKNSIEIEVH